MLNIYFGDMPEAIYNTEVYFKNTYAVPYSISRAKAMPTIKNHYAWMQCLSLVYL